jgi:undecaprenyl-diphosphatase
MGMVVGIVGLLIFLALAGLTALDGGPVNEMDYHVAVAMKEHAAAHPWLLHFARSATEAGGVPVMTALAIVGSLLLWLCDQPRLAVAWVIAAALGGTVNFTAKEICDRARPGAELRDDAVHERNPSYPSGHAMGTVIAYGSLGYVCVMLLQRRAGKRVMVAVLTLLVLIVGSSRVYLRAHWLSDVIGGFAIGASWLTLCISAAHWRTHPAESHLGAEMPDEPELSGVPEG